MEIQRKIIDVSDTRVVLDLPPSFVNRRIELIARTIDDETAPPPRPPRRRPHPSIAGKGRTLGDIVAPVVDPSDWAESP